MFALVLSACAVIKPGSLSVSQPGGIGAARVHFVICTEPEEGTCQPNETSSEVQYLLGVAVPPGSSAPATITATPNGAGDPIVFTRNAEVGPEMAAAIADLRANAPEEVEESWPPAGLEPVGYLSGVVNEAKEATHEWTVDADFGLPTPADGAPFVGPFQTSPAWGLRIVNSENSSSRPVHCFRLSPEEAPEESESFCFPSGEKAEVGTSDLKVGAAPTGTAFVGGQGTLQFPLNFGSTAASLPSFNVTATSTLPGATLAVSSPTFAPPAPAADTHRSAGTETVTVTVPKTAAPGVYDVTLTAATSGGGSVSQVAKFEVGKPKLKFGKVKLNKKKGTATLSVNVSTAGTLTASGKKIAKAQRKSTGPATLKVTIKAKGKAKRLLNEKGKAKVRAKLSFAPTSGAPVVKSKAIVLKKTLAG
ncbi:MAG TPA: hypothetical protein VFJ61_01615 [Solirubrobacterales bacterium]|nr:hypothetical protein [Solirubrobacterales bacterium]